MLLICTPLFLFAAPSAQQTVGGGPPIVFETHGHDSSDRFGATLDSAGDVNGDGFEDYLVGAPYTEVGSIVVAGSVYVYSGADNSLLHRWDGQVTNTFLGETACGAGDINGDGYADILIGNFRDHHVGLYDHRGSASLYSGADGSLLYQWDGTGNNDRFGSTVASAGDVNADGTPDVLIRASRVATTGTVYVYSGLDSSLLYSLVGDSTAGTYGTSLATAGDVNGDGHSDIIVGDPLAHNPWNSEQGAFYVYSGADGSLLYKRMGAAAGDNFGAAVASAGDVNADGYDDLIVGAPEASPNGISRAGTVEIFSGISGGRLHALAGIMERSAFGSAVSGAGDIDGDGHADLLIGAAQFNLDPGSAFLFSGADGALIFRCHGAFGRNQFGIAVSSFVDLNADGFPEILIAASHHHSNRGVVYALDAHNFQPYMESSTSTVSAAAGGVINLTLDFPDEANSFSYRVLFSAAGTGPSFWGVAIPLTVDSLTMDSYSGTYPTPVNSNLRGTLDSSGDATASLTVPAGINPALIGRTYYLATIANRIAEYARYSSVAVSIEITP